jgi:hypothetical protein
MYARVMHLREKDGLTAGPIRFQDLPRATSLVGSGVVISRPASFNTSRVDEIEDALQSARYRITSTLESRGLRTGQIPPVRPKERRNAFDPAGWRLVNHITDCRFRDAVHSIGDHRW